MNVFRTRFVVLCLAAGLTNVAFAQTSLKSLAPKHKAALERFLKSHLGYALLTEAQFDKQSLKWIRNDDKNFKPYYTAGDFNADRRTDFAVVVAKARRGKSLDKVKVLIFNGSRHGYRKVFEMEDDLWTSAYFAFDRKPPLAWLIYESDAGVHFKWKKGKYVVEPSRDEY